MELIKYIGRKVKIFLINQYYYVGIVLNADENSLDIKDIKGNFVSLNKVAIQTIQEIQNGN